MASHMVSSNQRREIHTLEIAHLEICAFGLGTLQGGPFEIGSHQNSFFQSGVCSNPPGEIAGGQDCFIQLGPTEVKPFRI